MPVERTILSDGSTPDREKSNGKLRREDFLAHEKGRLVHALYKRLRKKYDDKRARELLEAPDQIELIQEMAERLTDAKMGDQFDTLTGLYNFHTFNALYDIEVRHIETDKVSALIAFDVDYFKSVNDRNGHQAGDELLKSIAEAVQKNIRDFDIASRKSGDEFLIYLSNITPDQLRTIMTRISGQVNGVRVASEVTSPTISVGCVLIHPGQSIPFTKAGEMADKALYVSKIERGRFTMIDGSKYAKYALIPEGGGTSFVYNPETSGDIGELSSSLEQCQFEVANASQRILEEIEKGFGDELAQRLQEEGVDDLMKLSYLQIAQLLFEARSSAEAVKDIPDA